MKICIIVIQTEGFSYLYSQGKEKIKRRDFSFLSPEDYDTIPILETISESFPSKHVEKKLIDSKFSISVIIPTNSTNKNLEPLIQKINQQKGIQDLEIILIYSGSKELEPFEKFHSLKVITIKPNEFNFGLTRNLGIKKAKGDYIIFLSDDAIPISDRLFYDLCKAISGDKNIAASCAKQISRSDSDLMHLFSLNGYYKMLELEKNRITHCENFDELNSVEKRKVCQIDNVCSCYKKDVLLKYFFKKILCAEDLELGIRFVKDGYMIAQLTSTGVIHSHKRDSMYYIRHSFAETITLSPLLNYHTPNFSEFKIYSIKDFIKNIYAVYNSLCLTIDFLNKNPTLDISKAFEIINKKMPEYNSQNLTPKSADSSFDNFFHNISFDNSNILTKNNFILSLYLSSLTSFEGYLKEIFPSLKNMEIDFYQTLYKIFGKVIGANLGSFMIYAERNNMEPMENLQNFKKIMISGV